MCDHSKIQVIRRGRRYEWSCALCGDRMLTWDHRVWKQIMGVHLEEGAGFKFNIVERGAGDVAPTFTRIATD